ncbi:MAG: bifunctional folylpolyglutamate synthase/dihydrofolate synthase [Planctomycetes bacterium]|nr:bifunctional folylpolyglutamate synthase/dihydrofolate synthase [Planctomycetota bacterium]
MSGPFSSYEEAIEYLYHFTDYERMAKPRDAATSIFGLARMNQLLAFLGNPESGLRVVHIAGTKGKGSTATMAAAILQRAGARVGLYTSPHVECVRERIMVNGDWIAQERVVAHLNRMHPYLQESLKTNEKYTPTFFEIFTAMAFADFLAEGVAFAVLEVGLGGRLDATNIVATPAVCAITRIGFDHMDKLGDTLTLIASEKAGILKPGVPAVVAPQEQEALAAIRQRARNLGAPLRIVGQEIALHCPQAGRLCHHTFTVATPRRRYDGLAVPLVGQHQRVNAATAIALAEEAAEATPWRLSPAAAREGLASVSLRARIESIAERPRVIVDGAHNQDSARTLMATLAGEFAFRRLLFVIGMAADKDVDAFLRTVLEEAALVVFTKSQNPRAALPDDLARRARALCSAEVLTCEKPGDALALARSRAEPDDLVCVTGSFYIAGEVLDALRGHAIP